MLNYSHLLLLRGDFERGWPMFESRWENSASGERAIPQPKWQGESLDGRRVLIHAELGLGDAIQFIRYAHLIAERGAEVIVECPGPLVDLFRTAKGVHEVVTSGDPLPPFDVHVAMLSQPLLFHTNSRNIPAEMPYLSAESPRREAWRSRLGPPGSKRRVGVVWAGNPARPALRKHHIPIDTLLPLLSVPCVEFYSLQVDQNPADLGRSADSSKLIDLTNYIQDFADTAALMMELDLIISVDTAVAHLAGALERPTWTLLSFVPDWRWGLASETTAWYPTMHLFRQPALGDWHSVIQRVADELNQRMESQDFDPH
jgi:hypothetical protein